MKQAKTIATACQILRYRLRLRAASFSLTPGEMPNDKDTKAIANAISNYVESWVIPLIDKIERGEVRKLQDVIEYTGKEAIGPLGENESTRVKHRR